MFNIKILLPISLFCANLSAGPLWLAMELFEAGKLSESAQLFKPHCIRSPFAYFYCQHLAKANLLELSPTDAIIESENPQVQVAREPYLASLAYQAYQGIKPAKVSKKKAELQNLIALAQRSLTGAPFLMLAKILAQDQENKQINTFIDLFLKSPQNIHDIGFLGTVKCKNNIERLYLISLNKLEFRSVGGLAKSYPNAVIKNKKLSEYAAIFADGARVEGELLEESLLQDLTGEFRNFEAMLDTYQGGILADLGAYLGSPRLQNDSGNIKFWFKEYSHGLFMYSWAALSNYPKAFLPLIEFYKARNHARANPELAFKYALKGSAVSIDAKLSLGKFLEEGFGTNPNLEQAAQIFSEIYALDNDKYKDCAKYVGNAYFRSRKLKQAMDWYRISATRHQDEVSGFYLAEIELYSSDAERREGLDYLIRVALSPSTFNKHACDALVDYVMKKRFEGVLEYADHFIEIFEKAILSTPDDGQLNYMLGVLYNLENYPKKNIVLAEKYLIKASDLGQKLAWQELAYIYDLGFKQPDKALSYFEQAYASGFTFVANDLGKCLLKVGHNEERAAELFKEAIANWDCPYAAYDLAHMHMKAQGGLRVDGDEIIRLLDFVLDKSHNAYVAFEIAEIYFNGSYRVAKDFDKAKEYFDRANKLGHPYGKAFAQACKFIKQGKINFGLVAKNTAQIKEKIASKQDPNDILNFMIRLKRDLSPEKENASRVSDQKVDKFILDLEAAGRQKELPLARFVSLVNEALSLTHGAGHSFSKTKKGLRIRLEGSTTDICTMHYPHGRKKELTGGALTDGLRILGRAMDEKKQ